MLFDPTKLRDLLGDDLKGRMLCFKPIKEKIKAFFCDQVFTEVLSSNSTAVETGGRDTDPMIFVQVCYADPGSLPATFPDAVSPGFTVVTGVISTIHGPGVTKNAESPFTRPDASTLL